MTHLLAHQGGWDEILLVAVPLVALTALLVLANSRAKKILRRSAAAESESDAEPAV